RRRRGQTVDEVGRPVILEYALRHGIGQCQGSEASGNEGQCAYQSNRVVAAYESAAGDELVDKKRSNPDGGEKHEINRRQSLTNTEECEQQIVGGVAAPKRPVQEEERQRQPTDLQELDGVELPLSCQRERKERPTDEGHRSIATELIDQ